MTTEIKLRIRNITSKETLRHGSDVRVLNKTDNQGLETLSGFTKLGHQRNKKKSARQWNKWALREYQKIGSGACRRNEHTDRNRLYKHKYLIRSRKISASYLQI
jgi:hypothetical protein